MKEILLCGCGNIGFRHLQALLAMPDAPAMALTVVEPAEALHGRIRNALDDHRRRAGGRADLRRDLPEGARHFDLAVIATNAAERRAAFEAIMARHATDSIVFEKVLFQRPADIDAVAAAVAAREAAAFVNCTRRAFPGYAALRDRLAPERPIDLAVHGREFGLASNLIHFLDLAEFLNQASLIGVDLSGLHPGSVPAKRPGCVEVHGTARAHLANGARVTVDCGRGDGLSLSIALEGAAGRIGIDEANGRIRWPDASSDADFATIHVSGLGAQYRDLLLGGTCCLTPLADSARQHRLFLTAMAAHLGLPADGSLPCPVS